MKNINQIILIAGFSFLVGLNGKMLILNSDRVSTESKTTFHSLKNDHRAVFEKENNLSPGTWKDSSSAQKVITPEMFGAIGDGGIHKLSNRFNTLESARKEFPGIKDLDITIDGAAFQKAIDEAANIEGKVLAEKNYAINFPLITHNNVTIDGNNKGVIYNDRSRSKNIHHLAFFLGNYSASAFYKSLNNSGGYILYDVAGKISAGQNYAELANKSDIPSFKTGQLIMLASAFKRTQGAKKILLPYHITISKVVRVDGRKLYFEYPIDEEIDSAQIAANGNFDPFAEINFEGVENVTIRNLTVDAEHLTIRTYAYKCHIDNVKVVNAVRVIGINAMAHSTITNITGTFARRGIEIKTGSSDILVRNINATYKALPNMPHCIDVISLGQYNRNIIIDSFNIDIGDQRLSHALIDLHARKATISNGIINCRNQAKPFLKLFNERYVNDPKFGCYANTIRNVKFYGGASAKTVMEIGDDPNENNQDKKQNQTADDDDDISAKNIPYTTNVAPTANIVEYCLFDGGSQTTSADLNQGQQNIVRNCVFPKAKLKISLAFRDKNIISNNKTNN